MEEELKKIWKKTGEIGMQRKAIALDVQYKSGWVQDCIDELNIVDKSIEIENIEYSREKRNNPGDQNLDENHQKKLDELKKQKDEYMKFIKEADQYIEDKKKVIEDLDKKINEQLDIIRQNPEMKKYMDETIKRKFLEDKDKAEKKKAERVAKKEKMEKITELINGNEGYKAAFMKLSYLDNEMTQKIKSLEEEFKKEEETIKKDIESMLKEIEGSENPSEDVIKKCEEKQNALNDIRQNLKDVKMRNVRAINDNANIIIDGITKSNPEFNRLEIMDGINLSFPDKDGKLILDPKETFGIPELDSRIAYDQMIADRLDKLIINYKDPNQKPEEPKKPEPIKTQEPLRTQEPQKVSEPKKEPVVERAPSMPSAPKLSLWQRIKNWFAKMFGLNTPELLAANPEVTKKVEEAAKKAEKEPGKEAEIEQALEKEVEPVAAEPEPAKPEEGEKEPEEVIDEPTEEIDLGELIEEAKEEETIIVEEPKAEEKKEAELEILSFMNKKKETDRPQFKEESKKATFIDVADIVKEEKDDGLDVPNWVNKKRDDDDDMEP